MRYLPHTKPEVEEMLAICGVSSIQELFDQAIPPRLQLTRALDLPGALSEDELVEELACFAEENDSGALFLGAGAYDHVTPAAVDYLIQRGEFLTAYTPYQPEVSQGTLTAIFEFQTMIARLTGMEVANASLYEGASAAAEACMMASRVKSGRTRFVLSAGVHPEYREVIQTYLWPAGAEIVVVPHGEDLGSRVDDNTAAVVMQTPNFFGVIEDFRKAADAAHAHDALAVACVAEPISLGLLTPPGALGADVVCGEGQGLGVPLNFGGPYVGFFGTHEKHVRAMPGRLAGMTEDTEGKRGFVLTLATREQHIRRDRATSNICTNQGLIALAATIFMSLFGPEGMMQLARLNYSKAQYAKGVLGSVKGVTLPHPEPTFNEFVIETPQPAATVLDGLSERGFVGGADLGRWYEGRDKQILVAVTERRTKDEIDGLAEAIGEVLA